MASPTQAYSIAVGVALNPEELAAGAETAASAVEQLGDTATAAGETVSTGMEAAGGALEGLADPAEAGAAAIGTVGEAAGPAAEAVETAATAAGDSLSGISDAASSASDGLQSGTESMADALDGLGYAAESAADDVDTALAGTAASADVAAAGITTKASKFKAVGSTLGTEVAEGIAGGIEGPGAALGIGQSLSGLVATTAKTGPGILAALGLGLGISLVTNLVKGMEEKRQAVIDEFNSLFGEITVEAKQSMSEVKQAVFDAFTFDEIVTELGEGDLNAGLSQIRSLMERTGYSAGQITEALQKGVTPATREVLRAVEDISKEVEGEVRLRDQVGKIYSEDAETARDFLALAKANNEEQDKLLEGKRLERDFMNETLSNAERLAIQEERIAAAVAAAAASAQALAEGTAAAAEAALGINFDRSGSGTE